MSEEKAKYGLGETPIERERRRFTWLHNAPDGTLCNRENASAVRWDPECGKVVCTDCGMIFHAGAGIVDELVKVVFDLSEGEISRLQAANAATRMRLEEGDHFHLIVLALLLEAYGKPFTVPEVHFVSKKGPPLTVFSVPEPSCYGTKFWVEKSERGITEWGPSGLSHLLTQVILDIEEGKKPDEQ